MDKSNSQRPNQTIRERFGLRPIINVSGTMTALGASIIVPEAIRAMAEIAPQFVEMDDLHRTASKVVARLTGGEAGFITASCASGISLALAGAITGTDLLAIERLPDVAPGAKDEIIVQLGHLVNFGGNIDQSIRLAGGKVIQAGTVSVTHDYHVANAITDKTAAALTLCLTIPYSMVCYRWSNSPKFAMPRACRSSSMQPPSTTSNGSLRREPILSSIAATSFSADQLQVSWPGARIWCAPPSCKIAA